MATLRDEALAYEPKVTKNIADLEKIPVNLEVFSGEGNTKEGEHFKYKYAKIGDEEYRIPWTVLGGIKNILKRQPQVKYFQVLVEGTGKNTKYQVIPYTLEEPPREEKVQ